MCGLKYKDICITYQWEIAMPLCQKHITIWCENQLPFCDLVQVDTKLSAQQGMHWSAISHVIIRPLPNLVPADTVVNQLL